MAHAVAWNAAAQWSSQILSWISTIVVARLLTPSDYGIVGMAGLYLVLATMVSQVGIADAIIALRDVTRRQIAGLNTVAVLIGLFLVGLSCALAGPLARFFSAPALRAVTMVASITYLINSFQVVPRALLQKELRFKLIAGLGTVRIFCQVTGTVVLALLHFRYWSLVYGHIIGCIATTALILCWKRHGFAMPHLDQLRRELKFSGHVLLSGIAWYAYDNADFGVAGRVLGEAPLGDYTVAWTIACAPVEKIANLVTGVTPAYFSAVQDDKPELRRYFLRLTEVLSLATVPASIGIALVADYLVPVALGPKWLGVIGPLRLLGVFVAVRSVSTILPNLLTAIGDASFVMWATVASAVAMPVAFLIGSRWGTDGIAAAWVLAYPPVIAPMFYRVFRKTGMKVWDYVSAVFPALNASAIMAAAVLLTRSAMPSGTRPAIRLAIMTAAGALSYAGALLVFHRRRMVRLISAVKALRKGRPPVEEIQPAEIELGAKHYQ